MIPTGILRYRVSNTTGIISSAFWASSHVVECFQWNQVDFVKCFFDPKQGEGAKLSMEGYDLKVQKAGWDLLCLNLQDQNCFRYLELKLFQFIDLQKSQLHITLCFAVTQ